LSEDIESDSNSNSRFYESDTDEYILSENIESDTDESENIESENIESDTDEYILSENIESDTDEDSDDYSTSFKLKIKEFLKDKNEDYELFVKSELKYNKYPYLLKLNKQLIKKFVITN